MSTRSVRVVLATTLLAASLFIVAGCKPSAGPAAPATAATTAPGWVKGTADGVSLEVRGEGASSDVVVDGVHEFTAGKNKLRIQGRHVIANGKDYGPVNAGDSVLLDADGAVSINGQKH
jgi:hypothetical protein